MLDTFCFKALPPELKVMPALQFSCHRSTCLRLKVSVLAASTMVHERNTLVVVRWHPDKAMWDVLAP